MKTSRMVTIALGSIMLVSTSFANAGSKHSCPENAKSAMDASFGSTVNGDLTSDITKCLSVREEIKVVVNVSSNAVNGKNGINQQINNVRNMVNNYEDMYGLVNGEGYRIAVVIHGAAAKFGLDGSVYDAKFNTTGGNDPTVNTLKNLIAKGVHVYMCQNSMRANGFVTADLVPGIEEVPAGVTAVADFGMRDWVVLTP